MSQETSSNQTTPTTSPDAERPTSLARWRGGNAVLLGLLLLFAFFLGSFRAANADVWLHFASGRLLWSGEYSFGVDPFSWATEGRVWVNHSWAYDLIIYPIFRFLGPQVLVGLSALLVVLLAWLLLQFRATGSNLLIAVEITGLTLLVVSSRMGLDPLLISLVFFAVLLRLLYRGGVLGTPSEASPRALWYIPLLFFFWVNFDVHFMTGLAALVICLACGGWRHSLLKVVPASLIACCLNPHHLRVFTLPPEDAYLLVNWGGGGWPESIVGAGLAIEHLLGESARALLLVSPVSPGYFGDVRVGFHIAGLAYFVLLLLLIVSMLAAGRRQPAPRLGLCLVVTVLSLFQAQYIVWFALVAGPMTVLNFTEAAGRFGYRQSASPLRPRLERILAGTVFLIALFLAWPGWLHRPPFNFSLSSPRRVAWSIEENPSLRGFAESFAQEHKNGRSGRVFNLDINLAPYCAYFAPGCRTYVDDRFALFPRESETFIKLLKKLYVEPDAEKDFNPFPPDWRALFVVHQVDHVGLTQYQDIVDLYLEMYSQNPLLPAGARGRLRLVDHCWLAPTDWKPSFEDGQSLLFTRELRGEGRVETTWEQWDRRAFGPGQELPLPKPATPEPTFWDYYWSAPPTPATGEPALLRQYLVSFRRTWRMTYQTANNVSIWAAAAQAGGAGLPGLVRAHVFLPMPLKDDLPALTLLMIRESQRLIQQSPQEGFFVRGPLPQKYLAMGYLAQNRDVEEVWAPRQQNLRLLRDIQFAAAANRAFQVSPFDADLHLLFAVVMRDNQFWDEAKKHQEFALEIRQANLRQAYEQRLPVSKEFEQYVENLEKQTMALRQTCEQRQAYFDKHSARLKPLEPESFFRRFQIALRLPYRYPIDKNREVMEPSLGLADVALENLEQIRLPDNADRRSKFVIFFETFQLYLRLGRIDQAQALLNRHGADMEAFLLDSGVELRFLLAAYWTIQGDYAKADDELTKGEQKLGAWDIEERVRRETPIVVGQGALAFSGAGHFPQGLYLWLAYQGSVAQAQQGDRTRRAQYAVELRLFRGLFALECGTADQAARFFQEALDIDKNVDVPHRILARRYLNLLKSHTRP